MGRHDVRPSRIRVEACSLCQLNCPSCPNGSKAISSAIGYGYLRSDDFVRLLDANPFVRDVELSNYGEVFLNPELTEILRIAFERNVRLRADTGVNLNTADEAQLKAVVDYRLQSLTCSLDGASQETYGRYRAGGQLARVLANLRKIQEFKREQGSRLPVLTWQFIVFGHNEHEIDDARAMAHELGMQFQLKLSWDDSISPVRDVDRIRREIGYGSRREYREKHGVDIVHGLCTELWEHPQINWDGRVLGCSRNYWKAFQGNAFTGGLVKSLNVDDLITARRVLAGEIPPDSDLPCINCDIFQDRMKNRVFVNRNRVYRGLRRGAAMIRNHLVYPLTR